MSTLQFLMLAAMLLTIVYSSNKTSSIPDDNNTRIELDSNIVNTVYFLFEENCFSNYHSNLILVAPTECYIHVLIFRIYR